MTSYVDDGDEPPWERVVFVPSARPFHSWLCGSIRPVRSVHTPRPHAQYMTKHKFRQDCVSLLPGMTVCVIRAALIMAVASWNCDRRTQFGFWPVKNSDYCSSVVRIIAVCISGFWNALRTKENAVANNVKPKDYMPRMATYSPRRMISLMPVFVRRIAQQLQRHRIRLAT